ncbi:hypothetical protein GDO78_015137 [Eleutherodactylus coqui]|uniref:Uncharacterized protein n=1 Tax=Eleutherodactylus coqui TaxID=57060 RepID=A0A8J6ELZ4_ELECQ|nr:hypothetical protein GDO78_015137 [Eleutherodactylus coqui]
MYGSAWLVYSAVYRTCMGVLGLCTALYILHVWECLACVQRCISYMYGSVRPVYSAVYCTCMGALCIVDGAFSAYSHFRSDIVYGTVYSGHMILCLKGKVLGSQSAIQKAV